MNCAQGVFESEDCIGPRERMRQRAKERIHIKSLRMFANPEFLLLIMQITYLAIDKYADLPCAIIAEFAVIASLYKLLPDGKWRSPVGMSCLFCVHVHIAVYTISAIYDNIYA